MATYAIGDIQGCMSTLQLLLERIRFDPRKDHLLVLGDVVNRGPASLQALRWAYAHRDHLTLVLGNHDIALLAHAAGVRPLRPKDTFAPILEAHDHDTLLTWLRARPLAAVHGGCLMVHAGVLPHWQVQDALHYGALAQRALDGPDSGAFLAALETHAPAPAHLRDAVQGARVLTYLRVLDAAGAPQFAFKGPPQALPPGLMPWFAAPRRATHNTTIVCGHWAALGLHLGDNVRALDSGCVWGGPLTALCLETQEIHQVPYAETQPPLATLND